MANTSATSSVTKHKGNVIKTIVRPTPGVLLSPPHECHITRVIWYVPLARQLAAYPPLLRRIRVGFSSHGPFRVVNEHRQTGPDGKFPTSQGNNGPWPYPGPYWACDPHISFFSPCVSKIQKHISCERSIRFKIRLNCHVSYNRLYKTKNHITCIST